jgi:hypothetical protein
VFDNVLIGIDGRQGGRDAVALGRRLAAPQANLILAHTYGANWILGQRSALAMPYEKQQAEELLENERTAAGIEAELVAWTCAPPGAGSTRSRSTERPTSSSWARLGTQCSGEL